jgi:hypothetical protein
MSESQIGLDTELRTQFGRRDGMHRPRCEVGKLSRCAPFVGLTGGY